jgi:hypothetical protein
MNFILRDILVAFISSGIVAGIFILIFKESLKSLIQNAIKHEYDQKLEDYKAKEVKRQKAILIADLISEWVSLPTERKRLNQLTFEAFIWLPKETAMKLSKMLSIAADGPNVRDVLAEVRELIMGSDEKIDPNLIIVFPNKETKEKV